jgi:pyruvate dehydrogenase E1 component alpha subunit
MSNQLAKKDLLKMYELMRRVRSYESHMNEWYFKGLIQEPNHSCLGEEAINVGCCYGLRKTDLVMPQLRSRGVFFTKGVPVKTFIMTQAVKVGNHTNGHETSHHSAYPELGILGGTGMVGSSISIGVGAALALKYKKTDNVVINFFGDGGSNRGDFHEGMNFAAALNLPCIFVIENNQIAMTTQQNEFLRAGVDLGDRAKGYGIPGYTIDGNDIVKVYETAQECIERARKGGGPSLINAVTVRMAQHMESPFGKNNIREELQEQGRKSCPLSRMTKLLIDNGHATANELAAIDAAIEKEILDAFEEVKDLPTVQEEAMFTNVYSD